MDYIFILFIMSGHRAQTLYSAAKPGGLAFPLTPVHPFRLNNDAGSPPHGPRQMAGLVSAAATMAKVTSLALCVHLHPNTPIVIFIPATTDTGHCANPPPQLLPSMLTGENEPFRFCWCVSHHAEGYTPPANKCL